MLTNDELYSVEKPSRYLGGEYNSISKDWESTDFKVALLYPDLYEVGMSYHGLQLFYFLLNGEPDILAERVFTPAPDMGALLRSKNLHLWSLESKKPLHHFDVIAVHCLTELAATNILETLYLGGIPLRADQRAPSDPYVIAGGPAISNPSYMEPFFDAVFIGEADDKLIEITRMLAEARRLRANRMQTLEDLTRVEGIYVPALRNEVQEHHVLSRHMFYPTKLIVPNVEAVQERAVVELARGCTRGCRFCHAGYFYRPVRETGAAKAADVIMNIKRSTGFYEVGLLSLSTFDYSQLHEVVELLKGQDLNLSLPSLRLDSLDIGLLHEVDPTHRLTLTLAPETGSDRLRKTLNKPFSNEQILAAVEELAAAGWTKFKFYFMVGLPGETEDDMLQIAHLLNEADDRAFKQNRRARVHATIASFVPKPYTPFQWARQISIEEARKAYELVYRQLKRQIEASFRNPWFSFLEGLLSRSDVRVSDAVLKAWQKGAVFDAAEVSTNSEAWQQAFVEAELEPNAYLSARDPDQPLPWDHIKVGASKAYLQAELERSKLGQGTMDCRYGCLGCQVCGGELWPTMA
ncbi:radical SAM protein [Coprothermobacteraceae bacterium]|nr:radical SAM protein [Coprothermobacteraceae bacterium]